MSYELVSRALAYVTCMFTMSLFTTSMALAAMHVGMLNPTHGPPVLMAQPSKMQVSPGHGALQAKTMADIHDTKKI